MDIDETQAGTIESEIEAYENGRAVKHLRSQVYYNWNSTFELHVCRLVDDGQLRVWVVKDGQQVGSLYGGGPDAECQEGSDEESSCVWDLLMTAVHTIDEHSDVMSED